MHSEIKPHYAFCGYRNNPYICFMKRYITKFLCRWMGHHWNKPTTDLNNADIKTCERCGRKEKGSVVVTEGIDGSDMNVKWEKIN